MIPLLLALLLSPAVAAPPPWKGAHFKDVGDGLATWDEVVGAGPVLRGTMSTSAHYSGWLLDGTAFDSSLDRGPFSWRHGAGMVIPGWEHGLEGMRVGGVRWLRIPYDQAYGERGRPPTIPAKSVLVFRVELLSADAIPTAPAAPSPVPPGAYEVRSSGLKLYDLAVGTGAVAQAGDTVEVHYAGWLADGTPFDASYERGPASFPLGQGRLIAGWEEGIAGMRVGGRRQLVIPPELGYGDRDMGGRIPPGSTLVFDVELRDVHR